MKKTELASLIIDEEMEKGPIQINKIYEKGEEKGISERTMRRSIENLFEKRQQGFGDKSYWLFSTEKTLTKEEILDWVKNNSHLFGDNLLEEDVTNIVEELYFSSGKLPIDRMSKFEFKDRETKSFDYKNLYITDEVKDIIVDEKKENREHRKLYKEYYGHDFDGQHDDEEMSPKTPSHYAGATADTFFNKEYDKELRKENKKRGNYLIPEEVEELKDHYNKILEAEGFTWKDRTEYEDRSRYPKYSKRQKTLMDKIWTDKIQGIDSDMYFDQHPEYRPN